MSIGIVVPGVSSTIILMLLGIYPIYLSSVSTLHFPVLIPILIGVIIGGFCFLKLTNFLLTRFYGPTFYCIIGFTVGSIFVLLPTFSSSLDVIIGILSCILRFYCCFFTRKPTLNYKKTFFVICINFHIKGKGEMSSNIPFSRILLFWSYHVPFFSFLIIVRCTSSPSKFSRNILFRLFPAPISS